MCVERAGRRRRNRRNSRNSRNAGGAAQRGQRVAAEDIQRASTQEPPAQRVRTQPQQLGLRRKVERHLAGLDVAQLGHLLGGPRRAQHIGLLQVLVQAGMVEEVGSLPIGQRGQPIGGEVEHVAVVGDAFGVSLGPQVEHRAEQGMDSVVQQLGGWMPGRRGSQRRADGADQGNVVQQCVGRVAAEDVVLGADGSVELVGGGKDRFHMAAARLVEALAEAAFHPPPARRCRPENPPRVGRTQVRVGILLEPGPPRQGRQVRGRALPRLLVIEPLRGPAQTADPLLERPREPRGPRIDGDAWHVDLGNDQFLERQRVRDLAADPIVIHDEPHRFELPIRAAPDLRFDRLPVDLRGKPRFVIRPPGQAAQRAAGSHRVQKLSPLPCSSHLLPRVKKSRQVSAVRVHKRL
ncbi:MAG: hypothetical protein ACOX1P_01990 [Thermoguttaceae bacterium]